MVQQNMIETQKYKCIVNIYLQSEQMRYWIHGIITFRKYTIYNDFSF